MTEAEWALLQETKRLARWLKTTGLTHPDMRPFTPRLEGDEIPTSIPDPKLSVGFFGSDDEYFYQLHKIRRKGKAAVGEDDSLAWHNIIRACEEDR